MGQSEISLFKGPYSFLSNFHPSPVKFQGNGWATLVPTVEHAYQASKTLDMKGQALIAGAKTPAIAKRLGRGAKIRDDWEAIKLQTMDLYLRQKFAPGSELASRLVGTGVAQLIEGNDWGDTYWGIYNDMGENNLGKLLMAIRRKLRA